MIIKRILFCRLLICFLVWPLIACRGPQTPQSTILETELPPPETGAKQISSARTGEVTLLATYPGHLGRVLDVVFSPSGDFFATSGQDLMIRIWDTSSNEELQTFPMHLVDMADIDISPNGSLLANGEAIWDLGSGQELFTLERGSPIPAFAAFSPEGSQLALTRMDQCVKLVDTSSGEITQTLECGEDLRTKRMEFSPDGSHLAAGVINGTVRIWDIKSGEIIQTLHYSGETDIHDLAYSADGKYLAATGRLPKSILWDANSGEILGTFPMRDNGLGITFSPDTTLLAVSAGFEKAVLLFEIPSGELLRTLDLGEQSLAISFSPDGRFLAAGTFDGRILLWGLALDP